MLGGRECRHAWPSSSSSGTSSRADILALPLGTTREGSGFGGPDSVSGRRSTGSMIVEALERFDFLVELELGSDRGTSHLTSLAQSSSVYVTCSLVVTEEALEEVFEAEEIVMVAAAAKLGAKEDDFE